MFKLLTIAWILLIADFSFAQEPKFQFSIYFRGGSYYITEDQREDLKNFLLNINNVDQYNMTIHSHTDNIGGVEFNDMLSRMRSQSAMEQLLINTIRQEMISDVPLGALLSGGIDSSLVVALMQAQTGQRVRTFTIGFHEKSFDEADHAKAVATYLKTDHTEYYVTPSDAMAVIPGRVRARLSKAACDSR